MCEKVNICKLIFIDINCLYTYKWKITYKGNNYKWKMTYKVKIISYKKSKTEKCHKLVKD